MQSDRNPLFEGTKIFFLLPDLSRMPEDFLPHFFLEGYEVYYVLDEPHLDIYSKTRALLTLFPNVMLFFNIERRAETGWPELIRRIKDEYGEKARMGVLYGSQTDPQTRKELEKTYLYDIGITCGCIPIEFRKATNFARLMSVLAAVQAKGRRKFLRAVCDRACVVSLVHYGIQHHGNIRDISISHFSCVFSDGAPKIAMSEKLRRVQLKLSGIICTVDAIPCAKRDVGGVSLFVFAFGGPGAEGLNPENRTKINGFVHATFRKQIGDVLKRGVQEPSAHPKPAETPTPPRPTDP